MKDPGTSASGDPTWFCYYVGDPWCGREGAAWYWIDRGEGPDVGLLKYCQHGIISTCSIIMWDTVNSIFGGCAKISITVPPAIGNSKTDGLTVQACWTMKYTELSDNCTVAEGHGITHITFRILPTYIQWIMYIVFEMVV